MSELLIEYGYVPAYIIIAFFAVFWISIPFYLSECAKTGRLISKIQKGEHVTFADLDKDANALEGFEYAFGWLPNEKMYPNLFKYPAFKKHIEDLKKLKKFYFNAIIIISVLLILLLAGRIYVVQYERNKSASPHVVTANH